MTRVVTASVAFALLALSGCATRQSTLPQGAEAYSAISASGEIPPRTDYLIVPGDIVSVLVFQEPDLSLKDIPIDQGGNLTMPLIGRVTAAGKTSFQLSDEIAAKLGRSYLVSPKVSVYVTTPTPRIVVVEGQVTSPGTFPIRPETTLLETIALAKGTTQVAKASEVIVFRTVNGQRMGAIFDLKAIRRGEAVDPHIQPDDIVVVGFSAVRQIYRDFLQAAPLIGVFTRF